MAANGDRRLPRLTKYQVQHYDTYAIPRVSKDIRRQARELEAYFREINRPGGVIKQANQKAIEFLTAEALKNLEASRKSHRASKFTGRDGLLEKTIANPRSHSVSRDGFRFMVVEKVDHLMGEDNNYAFSLEFGSNYWVGKKIILAFLGAKGRGKNATSSDNHRTYGRSDSRRENLKQSYAPNARRSTTRDKDSATGKVVGVHRYKGALSTIRSDRVIGPREYQKSSTGAYARDARRFKVTIKRPVPEYAYGRKAADTLIKQNLYEKFLYDGLTRIGFQRKNKVKLGKLKVIRGSAR